MAQPYDENGTMFEDSVFMVFCNRVASVVFSFSMLLAFREPIMWKAPLWKYVAISLSNVYASTCQYEALKYVSFPVQMLAKSFKMMPVMVWGMFISKKQYKLIDWCIAAAVTLGVTEFLMTGPVSSQEGSSNAIKGFGLLVIFLVLDGFTSNYQELLFREYDTSKYQQMFYVNCASSVISAITLLLSGGMHRSFAFISEYPVLLANAGVLSATSVSSQWFIYSQIKEFGALVFAATMNCRQVVSIVVSCVRYGNPITGLQIVGLLVVFGALFYKSYLGFTGGQPTKGGEKEPLLQKGTSPEAVDTAPEACAKV